MTIPFVMLILGLALIRGIFGGPRRWRQWERQSSNPLLEDKVAKLEALVAELQEQADQDRAAVSRLEEERDFFKQLYPAGVEQRRDKAS